MHVLNGKNISNDFKCRQFVDGSEYIYHIPGYPIPLARPRLSKNGVWDCQRHVKTDIGFYLNFLHKNKPLFTGPLHITLEFFLKIPKKKKDSLWHTSRPDLDNMIKFYLDVAIGILYEDDRQISKITASKMYDENPRTLLTIHPLN